MKTPLLRSHLGALALSATLILAACGGGDASPPAESVPPTVNIASSVISGAAVGPVTFTFTFSEDVGSTFTADAVAVANGSKGAFTKVSATQYTLVVTPAANSAGNLGVTIAANTVADLVGNKMPVAATQSQGYDTRPPTVAITNDAATGTARGAVTFTFNFSKDVGATFTADDVAVSGGGTKGAFARVSSTQFTLLVTPTANSSGTLGVSIASGAFADAGGTGNPAAATTSLAFDTRPAGPTNAPSTVIPSGSVVIYSETATVPGFNARPDWGQTVAFSEVTLAGNKSLKYTFQGGGFGAPGAYEGMDWAANPVNVSSKTQLHMDLWSNDLTSLKISIISAGKETAVTQAITKGSWNSVDIDLAAFTAPDKSAIIQIKIESATAGDIYIDNIHFHGSASVCGTTAPTCAPTTTIAAGSVVIYSEAATVAGFNPRPDWGQSVLFSEANIAGNKSLKYTFQGGGFGAVGAYEGLDWAANPVNVASKSKLRMDLWSNDLASLKISIIGGGKESAVTQPITKGTWNAVDIDLASFTQPDKAAIIQIKIESATAGDVYIDNIHFAGGTTVACGTTAPTCAPTTSIPAGAVVIYSEAATVPNFNARPDWGQSVTFSEATIAGNKSLKYTFQGGGFGAPGAYEGMDWAANPVNVSSKGKLHMDLWSADITSMKISIISAGKENAVTQAITAGSWNSVDIDLASYNVPDKSAIIQIKIESATAGTVYIDNIHFWGTASGSTGGGTANPAAAPGSAGPVTIPVATSSDKFGFILTGDAIFAADYVGPKDSSGNSAMFPGATTTGAASNGNIGYYNDTLMSTSSQKLEEGGWVSGSIDQQGVPNFFRYFVMTGPGSTFSSSFMGLFVNAPNNGTVNVSTYGNIKFKLWGPAEMYEKSNFNPVLEIILAGPKVEGCTATGSGGTEISKTFTANQKIGAGSSYKISLAAWTVKGVCGTDTTATAAASVLSKLARVVFNVPGSSLNFTNANPGTPVSYSSGINLGPIGFTNQ